MSTEEKSCPGNFEDRSDFKKIRERLEKGNERYVKDEPDHPNQSKGRRECTKEKGQEPFAIILSCADSRVPPELIFDTGVSDLFVVRVAGNIANISSIASIEFAIAQLGCQYILVLGHEKCGAVDAAIKGGNAGSDNLNQLVGHILPAVNACNCKSESGLEEVTKENVFHTVDELKRCSTIIRNAVNPEGGKKPTVKIETAYYHLASGKVEFIDKSPCR
ncbi:carbonic anhydrase [uncultured Kordia sp.]|uniref:carbonic anhydrase n=1 Tax=uncultured Kordia sp. TaxID=507699 RepID=UPI0026118513|nr:carbonic anhydrase [uncultured Kordia sp.]